MQMLVKDILAGVQVMVTESETRMKAYIENGVQKDVRLLAEKVTSLDTRVGRLEDRMERVEARLEVITAAVTAHSDEIHQLKRVK